MPELSDAITGLMEAAQVRSMDGHEPTPEQLKTLRRDKNPNPKASIRWYLSSMETLRQAAAMPDEYLVRERAHDPAQVREAKAGYIRVWSRMRQARIFDVPAFAHPILYHMADRFIDEVIGGSDGWKPQGHSSPDQINKSVIDRMNAYYLSEDAQLEWPEHLPFESMYIGLGEGATLTPLGMESRQLPGHTGKLLGYVINDADRSIDEIILLEDRDGDPSTSLFEVCWQGRYELNSLITLSPLVVQTLIQFINEHRTIVTEHRPGLNERVAYKRSAKKQRVKLLPRPYYVVPLRAKLISEHARSTMAKVGSRPREYTHRYDVRGHERVRIERGPLPLDPKKEKKLLKRGYKIYTNRDQIKADDFARMLERRVPLIRTGEWVAILTSWVNAHVRGPDDAPYIPAVRKAERLPR